MKEEIFEKEEKLYQFLNPLIQGRWMVRLNYPGFVPDGCIH